MASNDGPDERAPGVPSLLGRWHLLRADRALDFAPGVTMEFRPGGRLLYAFEVGDQRQVLQLVYRVEDNVLHTEHPDTTHEVAAVFAFGPGDVLIFDFGGTNAWFIRELPADAGLGHRDG
ncbi:MAG: hypothetical protein H7066_14790 [Cytophagaceae bacterium]|nr:hypothetical protein [Gemmatimonadaceae bacterium]